MNKFYAAFESHLDEFLLWFVEFLISGFIVILNEIQLVENLKLKILKATNGVEESENYFLKRIISS